ncbi:hypothetical protein CW751_13315 [Brumimicrobium salinarum]|uniref:Uncharacterized protein n=1 Tax=Brumimicrobium salinarum TaxID=2058658 RepID=A0A2I0QZN9_9FLAO|nr:hypothetical protein [Brumimicrobium salinarum]PKR79804.1 hypothetical protein CW751_13315 [Brumimicrobium salinarum]
MAKASTPNIKTTHKILMEVNKNWTDLAKEISYTFQPNSEKELIQLHLFNVIEYLKQRDLGHLNQKQIDNRLAHIEVLKQYADNGIFPINNLKPYRVPIFIDENQTYCAVGFLLKESGFKNAAQEIAADQLLSYLGDIQHDELIPWQQKSGLSLFELALIQPTYGPPTEIKVKKSPIQWKEITTQSGHLKNIFKNGKDQSLYGVFSQNMVSIEHQIKNYTPKTQAWESIGNKIQGEVLEIVFTEHEMYINAFLPLDENPHQILKLANRKWESIAFFNGNISSIQVFKNQLYVLGDFSKVNNKTSANFVVIDHETVQAFSKQIKYNSMQYLPKIDQMTATETSLFLTAGPSLLQFKNDSLRSLNSIPYYNYLKDFAIGGNADTLLVLSSSFPGFMKFFDQHVESANFNNVLFSTTPTYHHSLNYEDAKSVDQFTFISGDFSISTLKSRINQNIRLVKCDRPESLYWYGEGLKVYYNKSFYPILDQGKVVNFLQIADQIYIVKKDGSLYFTELSHVKKEIDKLEKSLNSKR